MWKPVLNGINRYLVAGVCTGEKSLMFYYLKPRDVLICLYIWGAHGHPTMTNPGIADGNGLILYFRTDNMNGIRKSAEKMGCNFEEDIHLNPNSGRMEFSLRDPDGYFLTITEFHKYEG